MLRYDEALCFRELYGFRDYHRLTSTVLFITISERSQRMLWQATDHPRAQRTYTGQQKISVQPRYHAVIINDHQEISRPQVQPIMGRFCRQTIRSNMYSVSQKNPPKGFL